MADKPETPEPRLHSREWFAMKVQAATDRIEAEWPAYMKATSYVAAATLPTLPNNDREADHD